MVVGKAHAGAILLCWAVMPMACDSDGGPSASDGGPVVDAALNDAGAISDGAATGPDATITDAVQLLEPHSGESIADLRPTVTWDPPVEVVIQICADVSCQEVVIEWMASGGSAVATECLGVGDFFWRVSPIDVTPMAWTEVASFTIALVDQANSFRATGGGGLIEFEPFDWHAVHLGESRALVLDRGASPELFDPACEQFIDTGDMQIARANYAVTSLIDGRVLVTGGDPAGTATYTASTEIYHPSTGQFTAGPAMTAARRGHTATLLADGRVLIAGGFGAKEPDVFHNQLRSAEIYDPVTNSFSQTGTMITDHYAHSAVRLSSGAVLITGGVHPASSGGGARDDAELFDPTTGSFTAVADMQDHRLGHTMTLLETGRVLVAGGESSLVARQSIELYDPASRTFSVVAVFDPGRTAYTATVLPDGDVLLAGGVAHTTYLREAYLFDPQAETLIALPNTMVARRARHAAALLDNGRVLLVGGNPSASSGPTAELFVPSPE